MAKKVKLTTFLKAVRASLTGQGQVGPLPASVLKWQDFVTDPYQLGNINRGATYPLANLANIPQGVDAEFVTQLAAAGVTVDQENGVLTVAPNAPLGPTSLRVDLLTKQQQLEEQDWLARSTAPGVIFAHDFRTQEERDYFIRGSIEGDNVPLVPAFGRGYALRHQHMGTTLAAPVAASTNGAYETWQIVDGSKWPVAVATDTTTQYTASVSDRERVLVRNGPYQNAGGWYVDIRRTIGLTGSAWIDPTGGGDPIAHPVGTAIACWNSEWERPLTALPAPLNGKTVDDPGYGVAGNAGPGNWTGPRQHSSFRGGYWAHPSVASAQMGTTTPGQGTWTGSESGEPTIPNAWNGEEFYIQFRVKLSASKWAGKDAFGNELSRNGKLFYLQTASESSAQQMYMPVGSSNASVSDLSITLDGQTSGSDASVKPWDGRDLSTSTISGRSIQPGGPYENTCIYGNGTNGCWVWPKDVWVTILLRVKPSGLNFYSRSATLLDPLTSPNYYLADGTTVNREVQTWSCTPGSLANWPDPAEYPYYIEINTPRTDVSPVAPSGIQYEAMKVIAIDYVNSTITFERNHYRTSKSVNYTHPAGTILRYGATYTPQRMTYGWLNDPRLSPNKNGTIDVKVAVQGENQYTQIFFMNDVPMMYGGRGTIQSQYGYFGENPAAYNSFRASHYSNMVYSLSGAVSGYSVADYAQIILSKQPIACPQV